ncbi:unnamed protein product [Didymodactylos carnosus]|uniref:Peptidase S1 domain-containing protein n=1 Tax=Didymodactylos carnosus TaxID=1234261 RepID=A0A814F0D5_9BILA|nr:unnamed protein product [Didymodactylos carnosus]CAF0973256.1 unnamed protein product [Didymodactylos carnosus]CAF3685677.1 unnamed protein product [Didymodactylos carnosus]CAF3746167.1 unnamed protein product [Didymodactylos carnosus]
MDDKFDAYLSKETTAERSSVTCGCSENPAILSKIVGGEESIPNSFGWVVSIRMYSSHVCGGSIISDFWIITAAHCIPSNYVFGSFSIMAGIQNLSDIGQERLIVESFVHPQYDPDTFDNDIALVRLNLPLDMTHRSLAIICLPIINNTLLDFQEYPSPGTPLVGIGWGTLMSNNTEPSETLQQVTLETIANYRAFCMSIIHNVTLQFCAGIDGGGKDTCQGDSGGPIMMFRSTGQWELVGLTSYGSRILLICLISQSALLKRLSSSQK